MSHDPSQDDWTQRLIENPPDPLEYIRQTHEEWLTQLEGLAVEAIATHDWTAFYAHVVDFQNEHELHGEAASGLATSQRLSASGMEEASLLCLTDGHKEQKGASADRLHSSSADSLSQVDR